MTGVLAPSLVLPWTHRDQHQPSPGDQPALWAQPKWFCTPWPCTCEEHLCQKPHAGPPFLPEPLHRAGVRTPCPPLCLVPLCSTGQARGATHCGTDE